ncbi:RDD family protein [Luteolibacter pohnpeiensis]|uniref:RDD family protein n=1 Tax=Luteolibacter pohnpeiensis TaxID=454153 RepID=A0A934VU62_9BACT|nr:RDD family protein [Luteolibacter pohnpeiensis]MBK1882187.1 RDD family protein [Luteolibacter pohnpeiensis]
MMVVEKLDTLQSVELAEGVEIRLRMAGPMVRAGAFMLDLLIRILALFVIGLCLGWAGVALGGRVISGIGLLVWFLMDWFYPVIFEAGAWGATPGKRMMGLRVIQANGSPITFGQAMVRNFMRFIDAMPIFTYGFGVASCLSSKRFQRLGDLAAGTVVVYDRLQAMPVIASPPPMAAIPLPVGLSADETRALIMFRDRSGLWSEGRRVEIADQIVSLSGVAGTAGVNRLMAMAHWVQERRSDAPVAKVEKWKGVETK